MLAQLNPVEVWAKPLTANELYSVSRTHSLQNGGGQLYFQINKTKYPDLLRFLGLKAVPAKGARQWLSVKDPTKPKSPPQQIAFWLKSEDRMRTGVMNPRSKSNTRPSGWSDRSGFPAIAVAQSVDDAEAYLQSVSGITLFLARDAGGVVWAGFTKGSSSAAEAQLPYAAIAWTPTPGGYWKV